jgi:hypothetical protein
MKVGNKLPVAPITGAIPIPEETAFLINITESPFWAERTYGAFRIEGCKRGEGYVKLGVHAYRGVIDMGDRGLGNRDPFKNTNQFIVHAEDAALDLVRQWNTDIWGIGSSVTGEVAEESVRGFAGVFVADGVEPTPDELEQARQLLAQCDSVLVERADSEWDQFHSPMTIHAGWKRAARRLGVDASWLYTIANKVALPNCPHCGAKLLMATATVCSVCLRDVVTPSSPAPESARAVGARNAKNRRQANKGEGAAA